MANPLEHVPTLFKGIALFTPGGDLAYCIDVHKQSRWHLHLCTALQDRLGLSEPPHFLVPCYTATVDRWRNPQSAEVLTVAEARPLVMRHRSLLHAVFDIDALHWQRISASAELCDPLLLLKYRQQFPQLWQYHDLVVQAFAPPLTHRPSLEREPTGRVLTLFVAGETHQTDIVLTQMHQALEQTGQPYTLKVVDVRKHPEQAAAQQIEVVPTLVKTWPLPVARLADQLSDATAIRAWLESEA